MRIAITIPRLIKGGPILGTVALVKQLQQLGWSTRVIPLDEPRDWHPGILADLTEHSVDVRSAHLSSWLSLMRMRSLRWELRAWEPDVVGSYGLRPDLMNAVRGPWASVSWVRVLLQPAYKRRYPWMVSRVATATHLQALRRMDGVIGLSSAIHGWLTDEGLPPDRLFHVPNFLDQDWLNNVVPIAGPVERTGSIDIGIIGQLIRRKRVDWAIEAIATLASQRSGVNVTLHVIGDGPERAHLESLAHSLDVAERVVFHGWLEDVVDVSRHLDLVLHTSEAEGIPRAIMEAMAMGKTCLVSSAPGIEDLIEDGLSGYIFNTDSKASLEDRLADIVQNSAFLPPEQVRSRAKVLCDPIATGNQTAQILERVVAMGKAASRI